MLKISKKSKYTLLDIEYQYPAYDGHPALWKTVLVPVKKVRKDRKLIIAAFEIAGETTIDKLVDFIDALNELGLPGEFAPGGALTDGIDLGHLWSIVLVHGLRSALYKKYGVPFTVDLRLLEGRESEGKVFHAYIAISDPYGEIEVINAAFEEWRALINALEVSESHILDEMRQTWG